MPSCLKWGEERHEECNEWKEEGENECSEWDENCCDWAPCSWGCDIITSVCVAWTYVTHWVCVGWTWVTTAVCLLWDVATTVVGAIITVLESTVGWILDAIAFVVELIFEIPFLGRFLKWLWNLWLTILWFLIGLADTLLGLLGIRPEKKLRICTVILADERGNAVATSGFVVDLLQRAATVLRREANVRLVPLAPFVFSSGFADTETVDGDWVQTETAPGDPDILDVPCGLSGFGADLGVTGTKFDFIASTRCFFGAWRRVTGYGGPITCFVIRSLPDEIDPACGSFGCGLWISDYVTVRNQPCGGEPTLNRRVLAHELGHAGNLFHLNAASELTNLMGVPWNGNDPPDQTDLSWWQIALFRSSKHVTYV